MRPAARSAEPIPVKPAGSALAPAGPPPRRGLSDRLAGLFRAAAPLPVPPGSAHRFLLGIVAAMTFLAALSILAASAGLRATGNWEQALSGTATVQIDPPGDILTPATSAEMDRRVSRALELLRAAPGVLRAEPVDPQAALKLLEPWLGGAGDLAALPLPRLIDVTVNPTALDAPALDKRLRAAVTGARFDDHGRWRSGARQLSDAVGVLSAAILLVVAVVAAGAVMFSTHALLAIHRDVVEVLHIIGARDGWIAAGFARRAAGAALLGGVLGMILALGSMLGLSLATEGAPGALALPLEPTALGWVAVASLPFLAAGLAGLTARMTVLATLARMA
ncbi:MAG: cell division protein FtsX [Elsteraceae bacterium]